MDFTLRKEHEMARALFKEFAEKEVKPLAQEVDETEEFPRVTVEKMAKNGFLGIPVPKEYGGQGCDPLTYAMCVEELSKVCGTTGVIVSAHTSLCCDPIQTYGTEAQKQKYLVPLAKGEKLGAFGLTEPGAGTDAQGQQTKAVLDGDEWVLNGSKIFITNGKEADVYVIFAVTGIIEKRGKKVKEISAFIVEKPHQLAALEKASILRKSKGRVLSLKRDLRDPALQHKAALHAKQVQADGAEHHRHPYQQGGPLAEEQARQRHQHNVQGRDEARFACLHARVDAQLLKAGAQRQHHAAGKAAQQQEAPLGRVLGQ